MKILFMEGNATVRKTILERYHSNDRTIIAVSNIEDGIYDLFYEDTEFDIVIIGDELETSVETTSLETKLGVILQDLEDCRYFPVEFGRICIELCNAKKKKEPKIIVFTTCEYYEFRTPKADVNISKEIKRFVESNGMLLVDKTAKDFLETFSRMLK